MFLFTRLKGASCMRRWPCYWPGASARNTPITFSIAMNDYGFELLSDQPIPLDDSNAFELFSEENLSADILKGVNATEMARRKFRDIAVIGGLLFQGMPASRLNKGTSNLPHHCYLMYSVNMNRAISCFDRPTRK